MAIRKIHITEFMSMAGSHPVIDVRSPSEFQHAHIPAAINLPLFSDEERKVVGTMYKQQGRQAAILQGLDFFGVKMRPMVEQVKAICQPPGILLVHCWRGGMRSAGVGWLMDLYGFGVFTLAGGYKAYRNWVLEAFGLPVDLRILGGYTGSGKTDVLNRWMSSGGNGIDLEGLACHRGSAFGAIEGVDQPGQEMFENLLARDLLHTREKGPLWVEDESQSIGRLIIPPAFWKQMRAAPVVFMDIPFEARLDYLEAHYGTANPEIIAGSIEQVRKRLGSASANEALGLMQEGNLRECFRILLAYYDKYYGKSIHLRQAAGQETVVRPFDRSNPPEALSCMAESAALSR